MLDTGRYGVEWTSKNFQRVFSSNRVYLASPVLQPATLQSPQGQNFANRTAALFSVSKKNGTVATARPLTSLTTFCRVTCRVISDRSLPYRIRVPCQGRYRCDGFFEGQRRWLYSDKRQIVKQTSGCPWYAIEIFDKFFWIMCSWIFL